MAIGGINAVAKSGGNPLLSKHKIQPECRDVSRDELLMRERGQGSHYISFSADHKQEDWKRYPVDPRRAPLA